MCSLFYPQQKTGKRQQMETKTDWKVIFSHKLHSYAHQQRHSSTLSQTLLCEALNAKSRCFTSTCLSTPTMLLMAPTTVFDVDGHPLVSLSMISNNHLQSHCTISMPVSPIHVCLPAPVCWVTHDCVWNWRSATSGLLHALANHLQSHKNHLHTCWKDIAPAPYTGTICLWMCTHSMFYAHWYWIPVHTSSSSSHSVNLSFSDWYCTGVAYPALLKIPGTLWWEHAPT